MTVSFYTLGCKVNQYESEAISEIFEKAYALLACNDLSLKFEAPEEQIYGLADPDQLERAIHNILSNAAKYLPKGGEISASLVRREQMLHLSIRDNGGGIAADTLPTLFHRYLREPAIEDARAGLGLGMVLLKQPPKPMGVLSLSMLRKRAAPELP